MCVVLCRRLTFLIGVQVFFSGMAVRASSDRSDIRQGNCSSIIITDAVYIAYIYLKWLRVVLCLRLTFLIGFQVLCSAVALRLLLWWQARWLQLDHIITDVVNIAYIAEMHMCVVLCRRLTLLLGVRVLCSAMAVRIFWSDQWQGDFSSIIITDACSRYSLYCWNAYVCGSVSRIV